MSYVITSLCAGVRDGACVQVCPVACIHDAGEQFVIDPDECVHCGACAVACPVGAIFFASDLPEAHRDAAEFNRAFFR
ncbi:indolepyruvate ferredoxin oxidoreductase subunit alpha [Deinococcus multiflagellatus]|uniref:Ferredoxin n=1 Tax=Deinococcus multiflagellatus TaxID=1656887 RepID=A0ABW1ZL54_9DEIO|nr:4Fe-4S binding protein [Deinococcus multiflagellatus]MBZ9713420.1 4Fe-4S binding protein [Deinococcus multiflagellatus]